MDIQTAATQRLSTSWTQ